MRISLSIAGLTFAVLMPWAAGHAHADICDDRGYQARASAATVVVTAGRGPDTVIRYGTGVLVRRLRPHVVATAFHIIRDLEHVEVRVNAGQPLVVNAIHVDPARDLAFLRADGPIDLPNDVEWKMPPTLDNQPICLSGYSSGRFGILRMDMLSARVRFWEILAKVGIDGPKVKDRFGFPSIWMHGRDVQKGDSGGPLLDADGRLVGVVGGSVWDGQTNGNRWSFGLSVDGPMPEVTAASFLPPKQAVHADDLYASLQSVSPVAATRIVRAFQVGNPPMFWSKPATLSSSCWFEVLASVALDGAPPRPGLDKSCADLVGQVQQVGKVQRELHERLDAAMVLARRIRTAEGVVRSYQTSMIYMAGKKFAAKEVKGSTSVFCRSMSNAGKQAIETNPAVCEAVLGRKSDLGRFTWQDVIADAGKFEEVGVAMAPAHDQKSVRGLVVVTVPPTAPALGEEALNRFESSTKALFGVAGGATHRLLNINEQARVILSGALAGSKVTVSGRIPTVLDSSDPLVGKIGLQALGETTETVSVRLHQVVDLFSAQMKELDVAKRAILAQGR